MRTAPRTTPIVVWIVLAGVAAVCQVPIAYLALSDAPKRPSQAPPRKAPIHVRMAKPSAVVKVEESRPEAQPLTGQVVTVREPETPTKPPEDAKYLSQFDTKVQKEKKAVPSPKEKHRRQGAPAPEKVSKVQSPKSRSLAESASPKAPDKNATTPEANEAPSRVTGDTALKSDLMRPSSSRALLPTLDHQSAMANLQALTGGSGGDDALLDVKQQGGETMLNSRKFQHWDFFNQVKERVRKHWHPAEVYHRRAPTGRVYGIKDRLTVLQVTLDTAGHLTQLTTVKDSGVEFLDREARRALSKAAPFTNPPRGLVDKHGVVVFQFGFLFEISTSRFKFFRMPM